MPLKLNRRTGISAHGQTGTEVLDLFSVDIVHFLGAEKTGGELSLCLSRWPHYRFPRRGTDVSSEPPNKMQLLSPNY